MFDKYSFIDRMILKLNDIADQTGIIRCSGICEMYNMLTQLKEGLRKDDESWKQEKFAMEEHIRQMLKEGENQNGRDAE